MRTRLVTRGGLVPAFSLFGDFRRDMDRMFEDFVLPTQPFSAFSNLGPRAPRATMSESQDAYSIRIEIPGVPRKDLEVSVLEDVLSIRTARRDEVDISAAGEAAQPELRFETLGSYRLPENVDVSRIAGELKDGVLTVTVPKEPEAEPRVIEVKVS